MMKVHALAPFLVLTVWLMGCAYPDGYDAQIPQQDSTTQAPSTADRIGVVTTADTPAAQHAAPGGQRDTTGQADDPRPSGQADAGSAQRPDNHVPSAAERQIIYRASMTLSVESSSDTIPRVQQTAESLGGHLHALKGSVVTVRVPAARFYDAVAALTKLGTLTAKDIHAVDATEDLIDLQLRLDAARKMQKHLVQMLEKTGKLQDALKIEAELRRMIQTIERLQGQIARLRSQAAYSTIAVTVRQRVTQAAPEIARVQPFPWVRRVGIDALTNRAAQQTAQQRFGDGPGVTVPKGFVRFYQQNRSVKALSPEGVVVKITRHRNTDKAPADFWIKVVTRELRESRGIPMSPPEPLMLDRKGLALMTLGKRRVGNDPLLYLVAIGASDDYVYVYEAWGPEQAVERTRPKLVDSMKSLRLKSGWF